ncbi:hypothetical protein CC80DRAFT_428369 [Byssothecium circinans]|uniref:Prion-inhibition and propagation HeLo domain-containing protein n=1 Tax=Byssothecium circinans TaxID=147558 RepID=A0A6A5TG50_9PLEO|nr:hypothetical protein CC80DRAFT_428369 [Byssothecium circinans]
MAGLAESIGAVVGVAPVIFKATIETWKAIDDMMDFDDDTEDLIIRLETAKAHLGIWATQAGLTDGKLVPSLRPVEELVVRTLKRIRDLVAEVEQQGKKYGLDAKEPGHPKTITATVIQLRRSLQSVVTNSRAKGIARMVEEATAQPTALRNDISVTKRVFWAIRDKKRFEHFIETLEQHVKGLQAFIFEKQKQIEQDGTRLAIDIIQGLTHPTALSKLQRSARADNVVSEMDIQALAQWKAITFQKAASFKDSTSEDWSLSGSRPEDRARVRFLKESNSDAGVAYLFEKKEYDTNIDDEEKDKLRERVRQLLALLGSTGPRSRLQTLNAVGFVDDPDHHCWWIVFLFPLSPLDHLEPHSNEPLALRALYSSPLKPPLEVRYRLAKRIVDTFAKLYGSAWMHKGINSKNIIFPHVQSSDLVKTFASVETALIQGFNYSRQLTQAQTIDRGKVLHDLEAAIYRHPSYQGEAATGYQIHFDIYSLGLVLFEIAFWAPIMDLLAVTSRPGTSQGVALSPTMRQFHELEALELKRRVMIRVNGGLAYRVGTKYKEMIQWCLGLQGPITAVEFYNAVAITLDEICSQF